MTPVYGGGLVYYTGDAFPQWRGSFFVGALKWQGLSRIEVSPDGTVKEERFQDPPVKRRIRTVRQGPDGALYLLVRHHGVRDLCWWLDAHAFRGDPDAGDAASAALRAFSLAQARILAAATAVVIRAPLAKLCAGR